MVPQTIIKKGSTSYEQREWLDFNTVPERKSSCLSPQTDDSTAGKIPEQVLWYAEWLKQKIKGTVLCNVMQTA